MKNTLELWPEVEKSQVRAAFTPQGERKGKGCSLKPARRARLQSEGCAAGSAEEKHVFSLRVTGQSGVDAGRPSVT